MPSTTQNHLSDSSTLPDPWSSSGYADWHDAAVNFRVIWMREMGLSEEEIAEHCAPGVELDIDEEIADYNALADIRRLSQSLGL